MSDFQISNWPEVSRYKFIQVRVGDKRYIEFDRDRDHESILRDFLRRVGIHRDFVSYPSLKGDDYEVYGMGSVETNHEKKTMCFFGYGWTTPRFGSSNSSRYDIGGFDDSDLEDLRKLKPDWTIES